VMPQPSAAWINQQVDLDVTHTMAINHQIAQILTDARAKIAALDLTVKCLAEGYDFDDILETIEDITPRQAGHAKQADLADAARQVHQWAEVAA
jgi:hypothetical protein